MKLVTATIDSGPLKIVFNTKDWVSLADKKSKSRSAIPDRHTADSIRYEYEDKVFLTALKLNDHCVILNYTTVDDDDVMPRAEIDTKNLHLYGGAERQDLKWPYDKMNYNLTPYVTKHRPFQSVLEPYWLTSTGFFVYVDQRVPLFFKLTLNDRTLRLIAKNYKPYFKPWKNTFLNFTICNFENARTAHQYAVEHYLGRPTDIPDTKRVKEPIWSTWVRYGDALDADMVKQYAREIRQFGYGGQIEIDDDWEECYGSLSPNANRFEDLKALVQEIKALGFRVAIWVHPFVNTNCMPADVDDSFFVKNFTGNLLTHWWRGEASVIDFTNPNASQWYRSRLTALLNENNIDALRFDAGESSFVPTTANFYNADSFHPETIVHSYVRLIASITNNTHTGVARGTQKYPIFVTMMDRDTTWDGPLALSTLIPQLLQFNILGYSFVLPDMVGGNYLSDPNDSSSELFVRWLQANVFMPSIQFSVPPWNFDKQAVNLSKKFVDLHAEYADEIIRLMRRNVEYGDPVNPPLWWIAPDDPEALTCDSEYLLGENLLVAPVLTKGATERDIYLPAGVWRDENHHLKTPIRGPTWIRRYPADLSVLPYFTRIAADGRNETENRTLRLSNKTNADGKWFVIVWLVILAVISYFLVTRCLRMRKYVYGIFRPVSPCNLINEILQNRG